MCQVLYFKKETIGTKYINYPPEFWQRILWSDKFVFNKLGSDGKQYVRRPPNKSLYPGHTRLPFLGMVQSHYRKLSVTWIVSCIYTMRYVIQPFANGSLPITWILCIIISVQTYLKLVKR